MAKHVESMPEWLNVEYVENMLRKSVKSDIKIIDMEVTPGAKVGDNYCCQIVRIKVKAKDGSCISIIGKLKPESATFLDNMETKVDFSLTEFNFYEKLLPMLRKFAKIDFVPDYYATDLERHAMFLDDLGAKGFKMMPRGGYLDLNHCKITVDALATLHGTSYYAIDKDPSLKETFKNVFWTRVKDESTYMFFINAITAIQANIDKYGLSDKHKAKLLALKEPIETKWFEICELKEGELNFLLHGDCWINNTMFRHKDDGSVDSVNVVDYQIVNYGSFANDLTLFLFSSIQSDILIENLESILEGYYQKLKSIAPDIPNLSLERIRSEFFDKIFCGLITSIIFRPFSLTSTPPDADEFLAGKKTDLSYKHPTFASDLQKFLPYFEKLNVI